MSQSRYETLNGAPSYALASDLLKFFKECGNLRHLQDIVTIFEAAFKEDPERTLKALFYMRDIRQGQATYQQSNSDTEHERPLVSLLKNIVNVFQCCAVN